MSILSYWRWFAAAALVVLAGYLLQGFGDMRYQAGREAAHAERREAVKLQNAEIKKLEGDLHVTNQKLAAQAKIELAAFSAAAERSRADGLRLREQARQYAAANGRSQNPAAAPGSTPTATGSDAAGVLADLLAGLDERAQIYAEQADTAVMRGRTCERLYDAAYEATNSVEH